MEEQFSQFVEEKYAYVSQGKQKNRGNKYNFFTEDMRCNFIWWDFSKVQIYVSH